MKSRTPKSSLVPVGWREWVELPDLGISSIKAKVDTGARSSSLHAFNISYFRKRGRDYVRFTIHPIQRDLKTTVEAEALLLDKRSVKSSSGNSSIRPVIHTTLKMMGVEHTIELTLAGRDEMGFRMLIGREALRGSYLVDPGNSYYGGRPVKKKVKKGK